MSSCNAGTASIGHSFLARICAFLCLLLLAATAVAETAKTPNGKAAAGTVVDWNAKFVEPSGPSGTVGAFAMWDDGGGEALYAGANNNSTTGGFTTAGGTAVNWIGRWNGVSWSALGSGLNGPVTSIVAFGDELVVSGLFNRAGDLSVSGVARWNGGV